jgi:succinate dehydrogenase flavin-adding protein (antitoxin of CptAB toxin-antitoxin module)
LEDSKQQEDIYEKLKNENPADIEVFLNNNPKKVNKKTYKRLEKLIDSKDEEIIKSYQGKSKEEIENTLAGKILSFDGMEKLSSYINKKTTDFIEHVNESRSEEHEREEQERDPLDDPFYR